MNTSIKRKDTTSTQAYPREKTVVTHSIICISNVHRSYHTMIGNPETDQEHQQRSTLNSGVITTKNVAETSHQLCLETVCASPDQDRADLSSEDAEPTLAAKTPCNCIETDRQGEHYQY